MKIQQYILITCFVAGVPVIAQEKPAGLPSSAQTVIIDGPEGVLDNGRDGALARVAPEDPHVLSETDVSVEGHPGRLLIVGLKGDAVIRYKIVSRGNRLYVLGVATPKVSGAESDYEKVATTFGNGECIRPPGNEIHRLV